MKIMRAKFIYEKFTENSDPIHDLGIGVRGPHEFTDVHKFVDYVIDVVLPHLHGSIPNDILNRTESRSGGIIPIFYFNQLTNFFQKYKYTSKDKDGKIYNDFSAGSGCAPQFDYWVIILKEKLIKMGYAESKID